MSESKIGDIVWIDFPTSSKRAVRSDSRRDRSREWAPGGRSRLRINGVHSAYPRYERPKAPPASASLIARNTQTGIVFATGMTEDQSSTMMESRAGESVTKRDWNVNWTRHNAPSEFTSVPVYRSFSKQQSHPICSVDFPGCPLRRTHFISLICKEMKKCQTVFFIELCVHFYKK